MGATDPRPLPQRPPGGGARFVPPRPRRLRRAARHRARAGTEGAAARDPRPGSSTRGHGQARADLLERAADPGLEELIRLAQSHHENWAGERSDRDHLAQAQHSVEVFERAGDQRRLAKALLERGLAWGVLGSAAIGEPDIRRAIDLARSTGDRWQEGWSRNMLAIANWSRGPISVEDALRGCQEQLASFDWGPPGPLGLWSTLGYCTPRPDARPRLARGAACGRRDTRERHSRRTRRHTPPHGPDAHAHRRRRKRRDRAAGRPRSLDEHHTHRPRSSHARKPSWPSWPTGAASCKRPKSWSPLRGTRPQTTSKPRFDGDSPRRSSSHGTDAQSLHWNSRTRP